MSATRIVDEKLQFIENKHVNSYHTFENSIIKNETVGCTEAFNYALMKELKKYNPEFIKMHDSWVCHVCYAIGGKVSKVSHIARLTISKILLFIFWHVELDLLLENTKDRYTN
jgi:hypothetical protein